MDHDIALETDIRAGQGHNGHTMTHAYICAIGYIHAQNGHVQNGYVRVGCLGLCPFVIIPPSIYPFGTTCPFLAPYVITYGHMSAQISSFTDKIGQSGKNPDLRAAGAGETA